MLPYQQQNIVGLRFRRCQERVKYIEYILPDEQILQRVKRANATERKLTRDCTKFVCSSFSSVYRMESNALDDSLSLSLAADKTALDNASPTSCVIKTRTRRRVLQAYLRATFLWKTQEMLYCVGLAHIMRDY